MPDTSAAYALRRSETRREILNDYHYAMKVQHLAKRTVGVITRIAAFVNHVGSYIGNLQGVQRMNESVQHLSYLQTQANLQQAAMDRAKSMEAADEVSAVESLHRINADVWGSWPGMTPRE